MKPFGPHFSAIKQTVRLLSASVLISTSLQAGVFVYETPNEYTAIPDLDADGNFDVIVIDKATGLYRVGYGTTTAGVFNFVEGRSSGVTNVSGVAVGKLDGVAADSFAVTSPAQNRANILSPSGTGYTEPKAVLAAGLGPVLLGALDIPGGASPTAEDDLAVIASLDLVNGFEVRQIRSNASAWSLLRSDDLPNTTVAHGNPIIPHTGATPLFAFMRDDGTTNSFHAYDLTGTSATETLSSSALPDGSHFICGIFSGANADVMAWVPGQSNVTVGRISAAAPWTFTASNNYNLGLPIAQLVPVNDPGGTGVCARFDNGTIALYAYTLATGFSAPLPITPTGATGFLSGVVPMPGNAFQLLYSSTPGGPTSSMISFGNTGSGWVQTGSSVLRALKPYRIFANLHLLEQPLFRGDSIEVTRSYQAGDWITSASDSGAGPFTITANAATFGGSTQGIGTPAPQNVGSVGTAPGGAAVNQMHAQFSLVTFSSNLGTAVDSVTISPRAGTYATAQQITFSGMLPATTVYYRMNGSGAFQLWNSGSPPWITRATTVEYYASRAAGNSATQSAHYEFSVPPALQDSDGDGAPDFVELSYGLDPTSGNDADGDGFGDLDELAAGTNPANAASFPASNAASLDSILVDVRVRLQDVSGAITAIAATGTGVSVSDPFGNEIGTGAVGTGGVSPQFGRVNARGIDPRLAFLIVRGAQNFTSTPAGTNEPRGRELAAIIPALEPEAWSWSTPDGAIGAPTLWGFGGVNWQPGSSNWNAGAGETNGADANWSQRQLDPLWDSSAVGTYSVAGWVAELQAAMNRGAQPYAEVTLTPATSLAAVLFAHLLNNTLLSRFFFYPDLPEGESLAFDPATSFHFWRLRRPDVEFPSNPTFRIIAMLRHIYDQVGGGDLGAQALRKLARDIYAQHNALAPDHLGDLPLPLDALVEYVTTGLLPTAYQTATSLTPVEIAAALAKMNSISTSLPQRTQVTQTLYVRTAPSTPGLSMLQNSGGTAFLLFDANMDAAALPTTAEAPPGTAIEVVAYNDLPQIGGYSALEVISMTVLSLPFVVDEDTDGDLLADSWEYRHFGTLAFDGFATNDGSGYSLAQEYLEGTDPRSLTSSPPVGPIALQFMAFELANGTPPQLRALWPDRYARAVNVGFETTEDLVTWDTLSTLTATDAGSGWFIRNIAIDRPRRFFRPAAMLKH
jgi:hypothetical protein